MPNPTQVLVNVVVVTNLAAGASVTVPHGLKEKNQGVIPTLVFPDRGTNVKVTAVTSTTVTFENAGSSLEPLVKFRVERGLSMEVDADLLPTMYYAGGSAGTPGGSSGGSGGYTFYLNANAAALPEPNASDRQLSLNYSSVPLTLGPITPPNSPTYIMMEEWVTDVGDPGATSIPPGVWQFGLYSKSSHTDGIEVRFKIGKWDGATYTLIATSDPQQISNIGGFQINNVDVFVPYTPLTASERVVVTLEATKIVSGSRQLTVDLGGTSPCHVHTSFGAPGGTGLVKVVNGVVQDPASLLVDADVDPAAGINVSKLAGTLPVTKGGTGTNVLTARGITVVNPAGTALVTLVPGAAGEVVKSNGTDWIVGPAPSVSVSEARTFYVAVGGVDAVGRGAINTPFATIQYAINTAKTAYPTNEDVVIKVGAGTFSTGSQITVDRINTFIVGQGKRPEDQVTTITDPISVDCSTVSDLYNSQVGIDGCFVAPNSSFTSAAIELTGGGAFSLVVTNCYAATNNNGALASAFACYNPNARLVLWNCVGLVQAINASADIAYLDGGNHRIADTQLQHSSSVLASATSRGLTLSGASYLFADRLLVETRTNRKAVSLTGTAFGGFTSKAVIGNAGITATGPTSDGIDCAAAGLSVLLTDIVFTIPAGRTCVFGDATTPVSYGQFSFVPTYSNTISIAVPIYNNEAHGEMYLNALTASLPLKLNASKKVISQALDLSSAEVTNTLTTTKGGTGIGGATPYTAGDLLYASNGTTLAKLPIGSSGQTLRVSAGLLPEWAATSTGVTSVSGANGLITVTNPSTTPVIGLNGLTAGSVGGANQIVYFSAANTMAALAAGTQYQILRAGVGGALGFGSIDLSQSAAVGTSILGKANGGTGVDNTAVAANTVFAGPAAGPGTGNAAFRALVAADIPAIPASSVTGIPYDIAGNVEGTPGAGDVVMRFVAVRPCVITAASTKALCNGAPSGLTQFDVSVKPVVGAAASVGSVDYPNGSTSGTFNLLSGTTVSLATGESLLVTAPLGLNGIDSPYFTFFAVLP